MVQEQPIVSEIKEDKEIVAVTNVKNEEQLVIPVVKGKEEEQLVTPVIDKKEKEQTFIPKNEKINNEQKLERLKKINTELKTKEKRKTILEASLFSTIAIANVINKKKKEKEIKKNKVINPKQVEVKTNIQMPVVKSNVKPTYKEEKVPKGKLQVFMKPKKKPILTRISEFVNKLVILPLATIIRMERAKRLEKDRMRREQIAIELEGMKQLKRKLQQVKKPIQKVDKPKVLMKKKEEKQKKKKKVGVGV
jgi:hypothetical protein